MLMFTDRLEELNNLNFEIITLDEIEYLHKNGFVAVCSNGKLTKFIYCD